MLRDAGLGGVLALGRAREGALLAYGDDGTDLPERDIGHENLIAFFGAADVRSAAENASKATKLYQER